MTIPIIYYHSIADNSSNHWAHLSLSLKSFECQLKYLKRNGFKTMHISELVDYVSQGRSIPAKHVALTFDDGFLDNWVFAYPLLKKYDFTGSMFVNPDFIKDSEQLRANLCDVWNDHIEHDQLEWWGYASWAELQEMSKSGIMDIQSHGMTHNFYFKSNKQVDFHHPDDHYYWLNWLFNPSNKPNWLESPHNKYNCYGYPVYEYGPGICGPRYKNDEQLASYLVEYVYKNGGESFFKPGWRELLDEKVTMYCADNEIDDRLESQEEYLQRITWELSSSKNIIEERLGNKVVAMCWPNGAFTKEAHNIAVANVGYKCSLAVTESPKLGVTSLWGRVSFRQEYQGVFKDLVHFMKFISIVESMAGTGIRNRIVLIYQFLKGVSRPNTELTVG
ncbi:hypothetical protein MNBD_GAMMA26-13 [hydrothermal vent metagenome]|uniref:NodB homology domain-containing protein n=1 Tax=hydrothermal vent metagenome TaxID=652676 RepID=A0A3B1BHQ4_9ZZZZ